MEAKTRTALLDEFLKIADGAPIGRLVNADVGSNEFPDLDSDTPNRRDLRSAAASETGPTPNPEERSPAPDEQYK